MAKRTSFRNSGATDPDQPEPRRAAREKTPRARKSETADAAAAMATAGNVRHLSEELPNIPEPGDVADQAQRSESMSLQPSEEDIRRRAYQRYLERGGGHGRHFDDWLEAERELRSRK
jgi:hypothetical protein